MGLTRRHLLLVVPLVALLCAPLYGRYMPAMVIPFWAWWEFGCIAFAALFAWRIYGTR